MSNKRKVVNPGSPGRFISVKCLYSKCSFLPGVTGLHIGACNSTYYGTALTSRDIKDKGIKPIPGLTLHPLQHFALPQKRLKYPSKV